MAKLIKRRSRKAGLPAGSLVYVGEKKPELAKVSLISYDADRIAEKSFASLAEMPDCKGPYAVSWIDIDGLHPDTIRRLGDCFQLHPLLLEDILNTDQRPKVEDYENCIYLVLRMLSYDEHRHELLSEQVSLLLFEDTVISIQEGASDVFDPVRAQLASATTKLRKKLSDFLLYALLDAVVDHYFVVLEKLGDEIETLEPKMLANPVPAIVKRLHLLKRETIFLRKSIWPLREVLGNLDREGKFIREPTPLYLRDVYDHTIQAMDITEALRDILSSMLDIYLSSVNNRLNEIMKVLAMIATLFMPLSFIVGLYGMNFKTMPELASPWGYPTVLGAMALIAIGMLSYFKRKKWF